VTKVFERAPLLIQRSDVCPDYYTPWFSSDEIRRMLREDSLKCAPQTLRTKYERHPRVRSVKRAHSLQRCKSCESEREGFRVGDRSRGRFATPADLPRQDCSAYRGLHVRRESLGCVARSRTILFRPVPNRSVTIRKFFIAVHGWARGVSRYMYNVDVVRYVKGKRQTVNSNHDGTTEVAQEADVWKRYTYVRAGGSRWHCGLWELQFLAETERGRGRGHLESSASTLYTARAG
jgi:hypothetical protein